MLAYAARERKARAQPPTAPARGLARAQFIAVLHELIAEHAARTGVRDRARAAVEDGLDRIECCTEDAYGRVGGGRVLASPD